MAVPASKTALQQAVRKNFAALLRQLEQVPADRVFVVDMPGHAKGSRMSVANLLAYLIGWGELVLKWHRRERQGLPVDFPDTGYRWNQLGQLAQRFYQDYAALDSLAALMAELERVHAEILALIDAYSDAQLYGSPWYGKWSMGRMIQFNTAAPCANAAGRIRAWRKAQRSGESPVL